MGCFFFPSSITLLHFSHYPIIILLLHQIKLPEHMLFIIINSFHLQQERYLFHSHIFTYHPKKGRGTAAFQPSLMPSCKPWLLLL